MKKIVFKGSGTALVTPFNNDGTVNYDMLKKLIDFQIDNKTDAIIICGTTGEASTLTDNEKFDVIKYSVEYINGKVPVIVGTGTNDTKKSIEMSQKADKLGANGLLVVTPYYNKTSQQGLYNHYKQIAENVNKPIILYNVPSRTGMSITVDTYQKLSEIHNIFATKEASGNISLIAEIKSVCGDKLHIYSGNDDQIVPILSLGGIGVISVLSNIVPEVVHDICKYYLTGDIKLSRELQIKYIKLINALFGDVNPIPVKCALEFMGYNVGKCKAPLFEIDEKLSGVLKDILIEYKII